MRFFLLIRSFVCRWQVVQWACVTRDLFINSFVRPPTDALPLSGWILIGQPWIAIQTFFKYSQVSDATTARNTFYIFLGMIDHYQHLFIARGRHAYFLIIFLNYFIEPWQFCWLQRKYPLPGVLRPLTWHNCRNLLLTGLLQDRPFKPLL